MVSVPGFALACEIAQRSVPTCGLDPTTSTVVVTVYTRHRALPPRLFPRARRERGLHRARRQLQRPVGTAAPCAPVVSVLAATSAPVSAARSSTNRCPAGPSPEVTAVDQQIGVGGERVGPTAPSLRRAASATVRRARCCRAGRCRRCRGPARARQRCRVARPACAPISARPSMPMSIVTISIGRPASRCACRSAINALCIVQRGVDEGDLAALSRG